MISILKNLAWKELHEQSASAIAATAVTLSIPLCYVFRDANAAYFGVHTAFVGYPLFAGIFFGMRAAAGERASRTASFIAVLPVSYRMLGAARLGASLVAAAIPVVALLLLGAVLQPYVDDLTESRAMPLAAIFGWSMLGTACCVMISAVAGLGQPTEVRAGAVGFAASLLAVVLGWCVVMLVMTWLDQLGIWPSDALKWSAISALILSIAVLVLLLFSFPLNYYRALGPSAERTGQRWAIASWCPTPIPAPIAALVWKDFREIGFLGLQVFAIALVTSLILGGMGLTARGTTNAQPLLGTLPPILWAGGFVLAILIGVGAVIGDVQGGVNTFWRSRPIPPQLWYWTKYAVGLATILMAIEIPFLIIPGARAMSEAKGVLWWPLIFIIWNVTFSFAMTATCLIRQPAHAGILAIGAVAILYALVQAPFGGFTPGEPGAPLSVLTPIFLVAFVASTIVGAWAAERDIAIS